MSGGKNKESVGIAMWTLSKRAMNITPSATMALTAKVAELKQQGIEIIKFNVGEPDFDTPAYIREACKKAIDEGMTRYSATPGVIELREAVCQKLARENHVQYSPAEVSFSAGAKNALFNTIMTIVDDGDEVILPTPCWVSYVDMVKLAGGVPVLVPCREENGFDLDLDALAQAVTPRTKALLFNTPNNPTGAVYSEQTLRALAEMALQHEFYLIADEVYEKLIYDGEKHFSIASISEDVRQITFTANALSKAFAMTGWRMGYLCAPAAFTDVMCKIHQYTILCAPRQGQVAAEEALRQGREDGYADVVSMRESYNQRRRLMVQSFRDMGLSCFEPLGAFYVFPGIQKTGLSSEDFCQRLLREKKVVTVPGTAFGASGEGYIRCSYATGIAKLTEALDRMADFVASL